MAQLDERPNGQLRIRDVASLLGVSTDSLPGDKRQLDTLVELIEELLEKNGQEWIEQHGDVILDQWERLTLGI